MCVVGYSSISSIASECKYIEYGSISHHKSCSFCTRLYYVAIETVMHIKHGARNKVTFVLSNDRIVIRLLVDLAIDLKQF